YRSGVGCTLYYHVIQIHIDACSCTVKIESDFGQAAVWQGDTAVQLSPVAVIDSNRSQLVIGFDTTAAHGLHSNIHRVLGSTGDSTPGINRVGLTGDNQR